MTNWEFAKTLTAEQFIIWFKRKSEYGCRQSQAKNKKEFEEIWGDLCRLKYPGTPDPYKNGCEACVVEWLNSKVEEG